MTAHDFINGDENECEPGGNTCQLLPTPGVNLLTTWTVFGTTEKRCKLSKLMYELDSFARHPLIYEFSTVIEVAKLKPGSVVTNQPARSLPAIMTNTRDMQQRQEEQV